MFICRFVFVLKPFQTIRVSPTRSAPKNYYIPAKPNRLVYIVIVFAVNVVSFIVSVCPFLLSVWMHRTATLRRVTDLCAMFKLPPTTTVGVCTYN